MTCLTSCLCRQAADPFHAGTAGLEGMHYSQKIKNGTSLEEGSEVGRRLITTLVVFRFLRMSFRPSNLDQILQFSMHGVTRGLRNVHICLQDSSATQIPNISTQLVNIQFSTALSGLTYQNFDWEIPPSHILSVFSPQTMYCSGNRYGNHHPALSRASPGARIMTVYRSG